jgi:hypothetical protein
LGQRRRSSKQTLFAKAEARRAAGEMLRDASLMPDDTLDVMDDRGNVILRFCCSDVEEVRRLH